MGKLIFFLAIALAIYWLLRSSRRSGESTGSAPPPPAAEAMVACARCGLHVPRSESVEAEGRHYCCPEHRRLDAGERGR